MATKYSKLAKNTMIFTIGNFATKILSFLIVPLYTYILSTEEYGRIDLFFTAGSLAASLLTLQIHQAMMRLLLGKETNHEIALSNCMLVFVFEIIISLVFCPIYIYAFHSVKLGLLFLANLLLSSLNIIFSDYLLVLEKNILYAAKGIVITAVFLVSNLVALVYLKLGMEGYIYANIISQFVGCLFLLLTREYLKRIRIKHINIDVFKDMLKYCIPLIPNSLMWWIMSSGDKFIINYYLGDSANGLYSLAMKIPTVITMFYSYFIQAWVISAVEENSADDKRRFYENIYKVTNAALLVIVSGITLIVRYLFTMVMGIDYKSAWIYVPVLCLATAICSQTSFFSVFYTISKRTKNVFYTTLVGTVINVMANFILVQFLGLQGIAIGTCIGYMIVLIIRMKDAVNNFQMDLDISRTIVGLLIIISQIIITISYGMAISIILGIVILTFIIFLYWNEVKKMVRRGRITIHRS